MAFKTRFLFHSFQSWRGHHLGSDICRRGDPAPGDPLLIMGTSAYGNEHSLHDARRSFAAGSEGPGLGREASTVSGPRFRLCRFFIQCIASHD